MKGTDKSGNKALKTRALKDGEMLKSADSSSIVGLQEVIPLDQDQKHGIIVAVELFRVNPREVSYLTSRFSDMTGTLSEWEKLFKDHEIMCTPLDDSNK